MILRYVAAAAVLGVRGDPRLALARRDAGGPRDRTGVPGERHRRCGDRGSSGPLAALAARSPRRPASGLATLGAFTLASTIGLFGTHESWAGFYVFGAAIAEFVAIICGLALVLEDPGPDARGRAQARAHVKLG
jgi:hypothetical protein